MKKFRLQKNSVQMLRLITANHLFQIMFIHIQTGEGFPFIFDTVGGENLDRSFQAAALHGKVVSIAARSTHDLTPLHSKALTFHVVFMLLHILNESNRQHRRNLEENNEDY